MAQPLVDETTKKKRGWDEQEINRMVPGHRTLYKQAGITKLQVQIGRTKDYIQTPEQEHKERAEGVPVTRRRKPEHLVLNEEKVKELVDWMWKTRRDKPGGRGDSRFRGGSKHLIRQIVFPTIKNRSSGRVRKTGPRHF